MRGCLSCYIPLTRHLCPRVREISFQHSLQNRAIGFVPHRHADDEFIAVKLRHKIAWLGQLNGAKLWRSMAVLPASRRADPHTSLGIQVARATAPMIGPRAQHRTRRRAIRESCRLRTTASRRPRRSCRHRAAGSILRVDKSVSRWRSCSRATLGHNRSLCSRSVPPPTVPNTRPVESTSIFVPTSCGVLPTVSTIVTDTNAPPAAESSASFSTKPCGTGMWAR